MFVLAILNCALALVLGFWAIPPKAAVEIIRQAGYWVVLLTFALFAWQLFRVLRRAGAGPRRPRSKLDWACIAVIAGCWLQLLIHESFTFKVIMDEIMLLGTSMSLHFDKLVQTPYRGHDIQGAFMIVEGVVDKRPLFFPFLVSLLHDVTGYRPENAFVLNAALALVFLVLLFFLARRIAGRLPAVVSVVLFAGLPLLSQNATGGGFELLNLVMILLTLWLAVRYLETRAAPELSALCLSAVLLAQTRYESALFVAPVAFVILYGWWRAGRPIVPGILVATPLLLLPVPLLLKIFKLREGSWEMFSKPGTDEPFGLEFVWPNLAHAWGFFFDTTANQPNSLLFSVIGLLAGVFFVLQLIRLAREPRQAAPTQVAVGFFGIALLGLFGMLMCYFWGRFDDPVITRLSLPVHLLFVLAMLVVVPSFPAPHRVWQGLLVLALLQFWAFSIPAMVSHAYTMNYVYGREVEWRREFIEARPQRDYLVVDPNSIVWITHRISSTPPLQAKVRKEALIFHRRNRSFSEMFVFQRFDVDPASGALRLNDDFDVGPDYVLEPLIERRLHPLSVSRISRIVDIKEDGSTPPPPAPQDVGRQRDKTEMAKLKQAYWENWLRNLP